MTTTTWPFRVWLSAAPDDLLEWSNALYEAGGDDSTPGIIAGCAHVDFHRDAADLQSAILSAVHTVQGAGLEVDRIELTEADIASWKV